MTGTLKLDDVDMPDLPEYEGIQKAYLKQYDEEKIDMLEGSHE